MAEDRLESRWPVKEPDEKGSRELDGTAAIVAVTLIKLFGDEDMTSDETDCSTSDDTNKKKRGSNYNSDEISSRTMMGGVRSMKKRRYRSIDNLYMATKPIHFSEGSKYYF